MNYKELAEKALKAGKGVNLTPKFINFTEEENTIIGKYLASSPVQSSVSDGTYLQYLFDTDIGLIKFHLGSACDHETGVVMKVGNIYHIVFLGKEKISATREVNKYHIEEIPYENEKL